MSTSQIRLVVVSAITRLLPELDASIITNTTTLSDLGLDSVALVELGFLIETGLGQEVSLDDWIDVERTRETSAFSVESLVDYLSAYAIDTIG